MAGYRDLENKEDIATKIRDGSYFQDAREWYFKHYLYPVNEMTSMIIVASVFAFLCFISVINIKSLISENPKVPFIIKVPNSTDYFSVIKPLAENSQNTQEAIASYLITDYLKTREEYFQEEWNTQKIKYRLKKVKGSSARDILEEYKNYMSETNPYSPLVRYRDTTERTIEIKSINFLSSDTSSGKAKVVFEANTKDKATKEENKSLWEATVHFRLPDIETIAKTGAPLRFLVKYYKVTPAND